MLQCWANSTMLAMRTNAILDTLVYVPVCWCVVIAQIVILFQNWGVEELHRSRSMWGGCGKEIRDYGKPVFWRVSALVEVDHPEITRIDCSSTFRLVNTACASSLATCSSLPTSPT